MLKHFKAIYKSLQKFNGHNLEGLTPQLNPWSQFFEQESALRIPIEDATKVIAESIKTFEENHKTVLDHMKLYLEQLNKTKEACKTER